MTRGPLTLGRQGEIQKFNLTILKGQFTPKRKIHIFTLTCRAIVLEILAVEISAFSLKKMGLTGALLESLSRNHDPVTQNNQQTLL